jgi:hypothetical protein
MVDVINKKCIHENCNNKHAFNNYGETIAELFYFINWKIWFVKSKRYL